jgi:cysteine synthase A
MVCAARGYPLVVTMAENFSIERRKIMRFLGAKVVLTPASQRGTGMLDKARELAETHGWYLCRQFENEANAEIHSRTTAREILDDFEGERLDYWVTGFGTGGTLKGVARVLAEERPETEIVVCEPDNSPMLASGIEQARNADGSPAEGHPSFRTHLVQGWAPDFIPKLTEEAVIAGLIDLIVPVSSGEAVRLAGELGRKEGLFTGISGGATLAGALEVARSAPKGSVVLCMLPDTGERYLSTPLFDGVPADMTPEEEEISRSTPNFRFDVPAAAAPPPKEAAPATPEARTFVAETVSDPEQPVVIFALAWCEFCWAVRKMLDAAEIPYRSIDLDAVEYQKDDWGGQIRSALAHHTRLTTVPQVFVGGELVGGCTETLDAYREGKLQEMLGGAGVDHRPLDGDPYDYFPSWLHKR